jgi:hypothetical protein
MTMTRSKNSTFDLRICGRSTIFRPIIFSVWSCNGILICPICLKDITCFRLKFGGKVSYFDCHICFLLLNNPFMLGRNTFKKDNTGLEGPPMRLCGPEIVDMLGKFVLDQNEGEFVGYGKEHNWTHKCGLCELSYVKMLILMHNIDVMHQERNVGESILRKCMSFMDKTKYNLKARRDLTQICNRPTFELIASGSKPHTSFCLSPKERKQAMIWLKKLKFSDSYTTGFHKCCEFGYRKTKWSKKS